MGAITIRRLDDAVIAKLKAAAKEAGRSMEEEARRILEAAVRDAETAAEHRVRAQAYIERLRRHRKEIWGDRILPDSVELIRELRDEDPEVSPDDVGYP